VAYWLSELPNADVLSASEKDTLKSGDTGRRSAISADAAVSFECEFFLETGSICHAIASKHTTTTATAIAIKFGWIKSEPFFLNLET
jgi:hypothetical protein